MWRDWLRVWGWLANYTSAKRREEELIRIRALFEAHEKERLLAGRIQRLREENEKEGYREARKHPRVE